MREGERRVERRRKEKEDKEEAEEEELEEEAYRVHSSNNLFISLTLFSSAMGYIYVQVILMFPGSCSQYLILGSCSQGQFPGNIDTLPFLCSRVVYKQF